MQGALSSRPFCSVVRVAQQMRKPWNMKSTEFLLAGALVVTAAPTAQAQTELFQWTFTTSSGVDGSGTLTVNTGQLVENGAATYSGYLVTSMAGTYRGQSINSLAPINAISGWSGANDNLLLSLQSTSEQLDPGGIAFYTGPMNIAPGDFSFSQNSVQGDYQDANTVYGNAEFGTFTAVLAPEPSTIGLGLTGVAILVASRRILRRGVI